MGEIEETNQASPNDDPALDAGLAAAFGPADEVIHGGSGQSVLRSLGKHLATVPHVMLRDAEGEAEPIAWPHSKELPPAGSRYQLLGEIARGGMGAIIKGRDTDLGRDLAVKVLLDAHKDKPEVIQRFVEEAQIGGQLQHPGIVPVYELGQFADQRPFFSMKLVKGQTLSALLADRAELADERGKCLGIFEQVCQTIAYAHSRGVIHRDLKPTNIMVGAFGEVQVMDWGLAKVLSAGGIADEKKAHSKQQKEDVSVIETLRSIGSNTPGAFGSDTRMGSVMGTPAYMSPEQALGEIDQLDERADVFCLGAILCEILTGRPPYAGEDGTQVFRMASRGKLDDCFTRLDGCGADTELVKIAKDCLELEPNDRPRNAGELTQRFSGYLESVETRLRETELQRAAEAARVIEERKRRRVTIALATSLLLLISVATGLLAFIAAYATHSADRMKQELQAKAHGLYAVMVASAGEAFENPSNDLNPSHVLEQLVPLDDESDLREFTWRHLWHEIHSRTQSVRLDGAATELVWSDGGVTAFVTNEIDPDADLMATPFWQHPTKGARIVRWNPDTRASLEVREFSAEGEEIDEAALSPTGKHLALITKVPGKPPTNRLLKCVDLISGDVQWTAAFPYGRTGLTYSADGKWLMAVGVDGITRTMQALTGDLQLQSHIPIRHSDGDNGLNAIKDIGLSCDGATAILANYPTNGMASVRDLAAAADLRRPCDRIVDNSGNVETTVAIVATSSDVAAWIDYSGQLGIWNQKTNSLSKLELGSIEASCLTISSDGRLLGVGQLNGQISIWDLRESRILTTLRIHRAKVLSASFSPDGTSVASCDLDGILSVTQLMDNEPLYENPYGQRVLSVSVSRNGILALATKQRYDDLPVSLYDTNASQWLEPLRGKSEFATQVCFSPDGRELVVGVNSAPAYETKLRIVDATSWRSTGTLSIPVGRLGETTKGGQWWRRAVGSIAYSPDQKWIAAGFGMRTFNGSDYDQITAVWNRESGKLEAILDGHRNSVRGIVFTADASVAITGCMDGKLRFFDTRTWTQTKEIAVGDASRICAMAASPDGEILALGDYNGDIVLFRMDDQSMTRLIGHSRMVSALAFDHSGRTLASGSWDGTTKLWDMLSQRPTMTLRRNNGFVYGLAFSANGDTLFDCTHDGVVNRYHAPLPSEIDNEPSEMDDLPMPMKIGDSLELENHGAIHEYPPVNFGGTVATPNAMRPMPYHVLGFGKPVYSKKDNLLFAISNYAPLGRRSVNCWNLNSSSIVDRWEIGKDIERLAVSSEDSVLVAGTREGEVVALDMESRRQLWSTRIASQEAEDSVTCLALSPEDRLIAVGNSSNELSIVDFQTGKVLWSHQLGNGPSMKVSFSHDGRWLLVGHDPSAIIDLLDFKMVMPFPEDTRLPTFFPNQARIASTEDSRVKIWNWDGTELIETSSWSTLMQGDIKGLADRPGTVTNLAVNSNGTQLALRYDRNRIEVWSVEGQKLGVSTIGETSGVRSTDLGAFHPTEHWFAVQTPEGLRFIETDDRQREQLNPTALDKLTGRYQFSIPGRGQYLVVERQDDHLVISRPGLKRPILVYPRSELVFSPQTPEFQSERYTFEQGAEGEITHVVQLGRGGFVTRIPRVHP